MVVCARPKRELCHYNRCGKNLINRKYHFKNCDTYLSLFDSSSTYSIYHQYILWFLVLSAALPSFQQPQLLSKPDNEPILETFL